MIDKYYGDNGRWFIGVVISNKDPLKLDRVKVRIHGIHTSNTKLIPNEDLPWAQVVLPVTEGGSSGLGANSALKERAQVYGIFLDGKNSQLPLVLGSIPKIESPLNEVIVENINLSSNQAAPNSPQNVDVGDPGLDAFGGVGPAIESIGRETQALGKKPTLPNLDHKLKGSSNLEKIFNYFISSEFELTDKQVCGMMGNFIQEAGLVGGDIDIKAKSKTDFATIELFGVTQEVRGFGIAQWNPQGGINNRFSQLVNFATKNNIDYESLYAQVNFVKFEFQNKEKNAYNKLKQTNDVKEAALSFSKYYERPNIKSAHNDRRIIQAREMYSIYGPEGVEDGD